MNLPASLKVDETLILQALTPADAGRLFAMVEANRSHLRQWLPWLDQNKKEADSVAFIERSLGLAEAGTGWNLLILQEGKPAGIIGFNTIDAANRSCEIGYWLSEWAVGRGLITRSTRALIDFAFEELHLNRVSLAAATGNTRSRAVAERLGFIHEGTSRQAEWLYDHFVDLEQYALVAPAPVK